MSLLSPESELAAYRRDLLELNREFFDLLDDRRVICHKIQALKPWVGTFAHFDPHREKELFALLESRLHELGLKELLAFSLIIEEHALALRAGSYPLWSEKIHLLETSEDLFQMINPLLLKSIRPEFFSKLVLSSDFSFLKDF
jgi:chorismate mutase